MRVSTTAIIVILLIAGILGANALAKRGTTASQIPAAQTNPQPTFAPDVPDNVAAVESQPEPPATEVSLGQSAPAPTAEVEKPIEKPPTPTESSAEPAVKETISQKIQPATLTSDIKPPAPRSRATDATKARHMKGYMTNVKDAWKSLVQADYALKSSTDTAKSLHDQLNAAPKPLEPPPHKNTNELQSANMQKTALIFSLQSDIKEYEKRLESAKQHLPEAENALADKLNALEAAAPEGLLPQLQAIRNGIPCKDKWKTSALKDRKKIAKAIDEADEAVKQFDKTGGQ